METFASAGMILTPRLQNALREIARLRKAERILEAEIAREQRALSALPRRFGFDDPMEFLKAVAMVTRVELPRVHRHVRGKMAEMRRLAAEGCEAAAIAKKLKISRQTVYNRCSAEGIRLSRIR